MIASKNQQIDNLFKLLKNKYNVDNIDKIDVELISTMCGYKNKKSLLDKLPSGTSAKSINLAHEAITQHYRKTGKGNVEVKKSIDEIFKTIEFNADMSYLCIKNRSAKDSHI